MTIGLLPSPSDEQAMLVDASARVSGDDSAWWSLGIEHGDDAFVAAGVATRAQVDGALALVRSPDFVMMTPLSIAVRGRAPCRPDSAPVFI